jgi:hypothetical protein
VIHHTRMPHTLDPNHDAGRSRADGLEIPATFDCIASIFEPLGVWGEPMLSPSFSNHAERRALSASSNNRSLPPKTNGLA